MSLCVCVYVWKWLCVRFLFNNFWLLFLLLLMLLSLFLLRSSPSQSVALSFVLASLSLCLSFLPCLTTLSRNQLMFRFLFCTSPFFNFLFACQSIRNMLFIVDDAVSAIFPCYFRCFLFLRLRERRLHMQMSKNHSYTQMATTNGNNTYGLCPS